VNSSGLRTWNSYLPCEISILLCYLINRLLICRTHVLRLFLLPLSFVTEVRFTLGAILFAVLTVIKLLPTALPPVSVMLLPSLAKSLFYSLLITTGAGVILIILSQDWIISRLSSPGAIADFILLYGFLPVGLALTLHFSKYSISYMRRVRISGFEDLMVLRKMLGTGFIINFLTHLFSLFCIETSTTPIRYLLDRQKSPHSNPHDKQLLALGLGYFTGYVTLTGVWMSSLGYLHPTGRYFFHIGKVTAYIFLASVIFGPSGTVYLLYIWREGRSRYIVVQKK
jgi:hypothetical protein